MTRSVSIVLMSAAMFAAGCCCWRHEPRPGLAHCPNDSIAVGPTCVDEYEASLWSIPESNRSLIDKVKRGTATREELLRGAKQASPASNCGKGAPLTGFPQDGNWTTKFYAASVPGVDPTACLSWFQAAQACALSGKRLLTNQEWQLAAAGTPDPGTDNGTSDCNVKGPVVAQTGARTSCVSSWGVHDMVGNVDEWVADWDERNDGGAFVFGWCRGGTSPDVGCRKDADCSGGGTCDRSDGSQLGRTGLHYCFNGVNQGAPCLASTNCPGGSCEDSLFCEGGPKNGMTCATSTFCNPGGSCTGKNFPIGEPAAYQRGGSYGTGAAGGVFTLAAGGGAHLWTQHELFGFRCGR